MVESKLETEARFPKPLQMYEHKDGNDIFKGKL